MTPGPASPIDVAIDRYREEIRSSCGRNQLKRYDSRRTREQHREGADFEAVLFSVGSQLGWNPQINEVLGKGGPDFRCSTSDGGVKFLLEATCLEVSAQGRRVGFPQPLPLDDRAHTYSAHQDHQKVRAKVRAKEDQLSENSLPAVLAVGSVLSRAAGILGERCARRVLLSNRWVERHDFCAAEKDPPEEPDGLREYTFFKWTQSRGWEPLSTPVSAVLQVAVMVSRCSLCGVLHPAPDYPFDPSLLAPVPFLRLSSWPPRGTPSDGDPPWTMVNTDTMLPLDLSLDSA